jgi:hypothetical protein
MATSLSKAIPASASGWRGPPAPEGFEDVIAALNPITNAQPEVPANWSVTFAVDDADATAETAANLELALEERSHSGCRDRVALELLEPWRSRS